MVASRHALFFILMGFLLWSTPCHTQPTPLHNLRLSQYTQQTFGPDSLNLFGLFRFGDTLLCLSSPRNQNLTEAYVRKPAASWLALSVRNGAPVSFAFPPVPEGALCGPLVLTESGDTAFFSLSLPPMLGGKKKKAPQQLYLSVRHSSGRWSAPKPLFASADSSSHMHPAWYSPNKQLVFASRQPQNEGLALYTTQPTAEGTWTKAMPFGQPLPEAYSEAFLPNFVGNIMLFVSNHSQGTTDILCRYPDDNITYRLLLNSPYANLGLVALGANRFLLNVSQNGHDRLILLTPADAGTSVHHVLQARLSSSDGPLKRVGITLIDALSGVALARTETDSLGGLNFADLPGNARYIIKPDSLPDATAQLELLNSAGNVVQRIRMNEHGTFMFELLAPDDHDNLETLPLVDESLLVLQLRGRVTFDGVAAPDGTKIGVYTENNDLISSYSTQDSGMFRFNRVQIEDRYVFRVENPKPNTRILLYDERGNLLATLLQQAGGVFIYERLSPDDDVIYLLNENDVWIKIGAGELFQIEQVSYDLNAVSVKENSRAQLKRLVAILLKNPQLGVQLFSHTDSRGTQAYNKRLSEERAGWLADYLQQQGIATDRIVAKGLGEEDPVNNCTDGVPCTEEQHAANRRTEFRLTDGKMNK